jgi:antirestriction protein ArdC
MSSAGFSVYIDSWLRRLKSNKKALFSAGSKAREAADYLAGLQPVTLAEAA